MPPARIAGWREFVVVIGISSYGIDFNSLDGIPAHFICLMISPAEDPYIILQTMAAIIRFVQENKSAKTLFEGLSPDQIMEEFEDHRMQTTKTIMARDIMRPVQASVRIDSAVEDVARLMHLKHLDVLPVMDEHGIFCNEISCFHIFSYGLPDFFNQLHTISFLKYLDPFEKYFKMRRRLKVMDVLKGEGTAISENTTLAEIIFQLTIKNRPKLFVVENGRLVGEIDRFSIIDKILFF
jgi:CBS domain-containing protein